MADALKSDVKNLKTFIETHDIAAKDEIEIVLKFDMQQIIKSPVLEEAIEKTNRFPDPPTPRNVVEWVANTLIPILEKICSVLENIAQNTLEAARAILNIIAQFLPNKSSLKED